jgi:hypothetical protein
MTTSIATPLAAVLQNEVGRRVAALQQLADNVINDMQQAINRLSAPSAAPQAPWTTTAVSPQAPVQAPPAAPQPPAGTQLAHDDPRLHSPGLEVTNSPVGLVRSGWIATGGSLPLVRES